VPFPPPPSILSPSPLDPGAVGRVAKRARKVMASVNRPFTDMVFRWSAEGWQPAEPGR
jgi:hypothetical protein